MSNSQDYTSVPWYSSKEWLQVYEGIFSPTSDISAKREALRTVLLWKGRTAYLPSHIDSTLGLLEVELEPPSSDRILRLLYSSVIMRYINHTLDNAPFKGQTLLQAAASLNIPQWIVNLRHETAHGHDLPPLPLLRSAALHSVNWLFDNYWLPQRQSIQDYTTHCRTETVPETDWSLLINNYSLLAIFSCSRFNIIKLKDIPDEDIKLSLFEFVCDRIMKSRIEAHWEVQIKKIYRRVLKELSHALIKSVDQTKDQQISKILTDKESLFMTSEFDFPNKIDSLPDWFISIFEPLLALLHKQHIISSLVTELFKVSNDDREVPERRLRAAQWIKEISIGLHKSTLFLALDHKFVPDKEVHKHDKQKEMLKILIHHHPNQKYGLTLDLMTPVPEIFSKKLFIFHNLSSYNEYIKIYIKQFICLNANILSDTTIKQIMYLVELMVTEQPTNSHIKDIRTVEDLVNACGEKMITDHSEDPQTNEVFSASKWEVASSDYNWAGCPLGVLPWQLDKGDNPSLPPMNSV